MTELSDRVKEGKEFFTDAIDGIGLSIRDLDLLGRISTIRQDRRIKSVKLVDHRKVGETDSPVLKGSEDVNIYNFNAYLNDDFTDETQAERQMKSILRRVKLRPGPLDSADTRNYHFGTKNNWFYIDFIEPSKQEK